MTTFLKSFIIPALLCCFNLSVSAVRNVNLTFRNDSVILGATLSLPDSTPKGAVVLATGSGSQNRDEEVVGHKPFKAIADALASGGYAVLRFDDRGTGESTGDAASATAKVYATDLAAGIRLLRDTIGPDVKVGIIGHSEGGTAAILASDKTDFIITLAAPAWPGDSIVMSQARAMTTAMTGEWDGETIQRRLLDLVKSPIPDLLLPSMLYLELAKALGSAADLPQVQQQIRMQTSAMATPAYREMVRYNPSDDMAGVGVPWLALNGDRDFQVLPGNLSTIKELNPKAETVLLPGHNHLFLECKTGFIHEYSELNGDISDMTLKTILNWLDSAIN